MNTKKLEVYTDGGCIKNPGGIGAWAFVIDDSGKKIRLSGGEKVTTNNRMEMMAVIKALEFIGKNFTCNLNITIRTDSQYVQKGITEWIVSWKKNGWKNSSNKPVKNLELWKQMDKLVNSFPYLHFEWVHGHAGVLMNELCDRMVKHKMKEIEAESRK